MSSNSNIIEISSDESSPKLLNSQGQEAGSSIGYSLSRKESRYHAYDMEFEELQSEPLPPPKRRRQTSQGVTTFSQVAVPSQVATPSQVAASSQISTPSQIATPLQVSARSQTIEDEIEVIEVVHSQTRPRTQVSNIKDEGSQNDIVPHPEIRPRVDPQVKTCDRHKRLKQSCKMDTEMCKAHSSCRKNGDPIFTPESIFVTCTWCTDWFLYEKFSSDPSQHREIKNLVEKGHKEKTIDAIKSLQDMLLNNAAIFENTKALIIKAEELKQEIAQLHQKRIRTSYYAQELEDIMAQGWTSQVLECFEGLVKYFYFAQKVDQSSSIISTDPDIVYKWMRAKDQASRFEGPNAPLFLTLKDFWCKHFQNLPKTDIMRWVYEEWLLNKTISYHERRRRQVLVLDHSFQTNLFDYLTFVRHMNAHYGDNPIVFQELVTAHGDTVTDSNFYRIVERSFMLVFDKLCSYGFRGLLASLVEEQTPLDVKASIRSFIDLNVVKRLISSRVVPWKPGESIEEVMIKCNMHF